MANKYAREYNSGSKEVAFLDTGKCRSYEEEIEDMINKAVAEFPVFEEASWFLELARRRLLDFTSGRKKVFVVGNSLPDEIFWMFGITPVRLMGGSRILTGISDSDLPRDADPVTRAVYGFLSQIDGNPLTVVPLVNDSSRKIAYLLKRKGKDVYTVSVPPMKNVGALAEWSRQMELLAEKLSVYTRRSYSKRRLQKAGKEVADAKRQLQIFELLAGKRQQNLSGIFRIFVPFCYLLADDYREWTRQMLAVNRRLAKMKEDADTSIRKVLLFGSPVYFPNYKVPFLLKEAGLSFGGNFIVSDVIKTYDGTGGFEEMCRRSFVNDGSSSYVKNDTLFLKISQYLKQYPVDGAVCHVLKGQIEFDFEMERFERLFAKYDVPVIRMETDYSNQDVEQLRLRVEAFAEMLKQRKSGK